MTIPRALGDRPRTPNVRSLSGGMDPECRLQSPGLQALLAYWQGRCPAAGRLPGRADIDPVDFPALLPNVYLVNVQIAPRLYRYRLVGTEIAEAYGQDFTGKRVDELFSDIFRKAVTVVFDAIVDRRAPLRTFGTLAWRETQQLRFEAIQMPLAADHDTIDMILGAMAYV